MLIRLTILLGLIHTSAFAALKLRTDNITLSGLSSGAYMAGQLHVAYSETFSGVGIIAGGPYNCARGSLMTALMQCMNVYQGAPDGERLLRDAHILVRSGEIDSLENLLDDRVFILAGKNDRTVLPVVVKENLGFYSDLPNSSVLLVDDMNVGHAFPTIDRGNPCSVASQSPWVSACNRDIAGEMLSHLLGEKLEKRIKASDSSYFLYRQASAASMASHGVAYVPKKCRQGFECSLHVALHGCRQTEDEIGDYFFRHTGINEYAESNNLVVIYPRTIKTPDLVNPNGCWDWWGYASADYALKSGPQMRAVKEAVDNFLNDSIVLETLD